jgi:hypothetical protein
MLMVILVLHLVLAVEVMVMMGAVASVTVIFTVTAINC